jgi:hypothetical protein
MTARRPNTRHMAAREVSAVLWGNRQTIHRLRQVLLTCDAFVDVTGAKSLRGALHTVRRWAARRA